MDIEKLVHSVLQRSQPPLQQSNVSPNMQGRPQNNYAMMGPYPAVRQGLNYPNITWKSETVMEAEGTHYYYYYLF
jgi:hypothetical protein